jgi:hypothetical protein
MEPLGALTVKTAAMIHGRDVPRSLNRRNPAGYTKAVVDVLVRQRRRDSNTRSATNHRNNTKMITAGLNATIRALAAELRALKASQGTTSECTSCIITETKMCAIAHVYDCSPWVVDPAILS